MLNPQGRFLFDMFLYRPSRSVERLDRSGSGPASEGEGGSASDAPTLLADVDAGILDDFLAELKKHRLRAKVSFEDVSAELKVWARFGGVLDDDPGTPSEEAAGAVGYGATNDPQGQAAAEAESSGWSWHRDPRLPSLGLRSLFPDFPPLVEAQEELEERHYQLWRFEEGVAEGPKEIPSGEALPLEYNLAGLNAISFDKGCYVGQELTARTHNRGVIRKRLLPVQFMSRDSKQEQQTPVAAGAVVLDAEGGKKVGTVTAASGPRGLAHLRLQPALRENAALVVEGEGAAGVRVVRPKWWPAEWGHEEGS
eukprot:SM000168S02579  [mRNA]  locus=s168:33016:35003:+ [translate_table: standard]